MIIASIELNYWVQFPYLRGTIPHLNALCPLAVPNSARGASTSRHARTAGTRDAYVKSVVARPLTGRNAVVEDRSSFAGNSLQPGK